MRPGTSLRIRVPWPAQSGDTTEPSYRVPFLFSTNGRAYLKQLETQSGIWHRDARDPTNRRRALADWPTPDGLKAMLDIDRAAASAALTVLPFDFAFGLRDYQMRGIQAVETALADDERRSLLLAMATGTGKTKLAVALLYRLLHTRRFRRVCFVVDRTALGDQAKDAFTTTRIVSARTFADIFGLKVLGDTAPDPDTKVHICTIQGLVKRVLFAATPEEVPPVDQYDLMLVDECHRGYTLDREMSDAELGFRSEADYISKYRRVIEHFDAVRIADGDFLMSRANTLELVGAPVIAQGVPADTFLSDKVLRLRFRESVDRWVLWFLRSPAGRREIEARSSGNQLSMRNIGQGALRDIPVPMPAADVWAQTIAAIERGEECVTAASRDATRSLALLDRLEQSILARAFRGQLVPQEPNASDVTPETASNLPDGKGVPRRARRAA